MNTEAEHASPPALLAGLRLRCPNCGEGRVFQSYLAFAPGCTHCGVSFDVADTGDGPAVFVMFLVGAIVTPLALALNFGLRLPDWATLGISGVLAIALSLALLPRLKSLLFALQWRHKAGEAGLERDH
jgi:uncharacterized protein (DUF983 family)